MKKLIPILLAVFALASCEKDPDMGKLDNNYLVYTNYDKKADFKVPTFYLADQILVINDSKEPEYLEGDNCKSQRTGSTIRHPSFRPSNRDPNNRDSPTTIRADCSW